MRDNYSQPFCIVSDADSMHELVGGLFGDTAGGPETAEANARLIVKAVNSHEKMLSCLNELIEIVREFRGTIPKGDMFKRLKRIDDAIERATGVRP